MIKKYMNVSYRKLRSSLDSSLCQETGLDDSKKTNTLFTSIPSPATYTNETPKEPALTLPIEYDPNHPRVIWFRNKWGTGYLNGSK